MAYKASQGKARGHLELPCHDILAKDLGHGAPGSLTIERG